MIILTVFFYIQYLKNMYPANTYESVIDMALKESLGFTLSRHSGAEK